jgi:hypothetical protein
MPLLLALFCFTIYYFPGACIVMLTDMNAILTHWSQCISDMKF